MNTEFVFKFKRRFSVVIASVMALVLVLGSAAPSYATLTSIPAAVQTESVASSKYFEDEYYKVTTPLDEDKVIYVEGRTKIKTQRFCIRVKKHGGSYAVTVFVKPDKNGEFSIKINTAKGNTDVPEVIDGKGTVAKAEDCWDTCPGNKAVESMTKGTYHLTIARAKTSSDADISSEASQKWYDGPLGGGDGYAYKETVLTVNEGQNNNPKVVKYDKAIKNNNTVRNSQEKKSYHDESYKGSYVRYKDTYLKDMQYLALTNPATGEVENLTAKNVSYLKDVANKVTDGADSDYEKLVKIYEYVASNVYYDELANIKYKNQYANPYKNLYNLRNKVNSANSKSGKVATTCQGYAAMVIALARCEGIPARAVNGHHISQPQKLWSELTSSQIQKRDHWWSEAWVDGRWVIIDACSATYSKWKRDSFSAKGTWVKGTDISYAHFDPSEEQLSNSFSYNEVYPGAMDGKFINRNNEVDQLRTFLNTKYSGKTNGKRLNSKYSSSKPATWGTGKKDNFKTDGEGRVTHISWGEKNLYGTMNLSGFSKLAYLTVYNNKLKKLNLTGCSNLKSVSATYNDLTAFDSSAAKADKLRVKGNELTTAKFKNGSKAVTIKRNVKGGTFSFDYDKSKSKNLTIYVNNPKSGYKYLGIYNGSGKKLSSSKTYTFKASSSTYVVKFKKK